jgi:hypothetical protein
MMCGARKKRFEDLVRIIESFLSLNAIASSTCINNVEKLPAHE